ncbi:MAG: 3-hydroxyacyl-CoA dehydrogenase, partial [Alphaproteobacteria bacterium]
MSAHPCLIGVVGTGAMGRGIAQIMAAAGSHVKMFDASAGAAQDALAFIRKMLARAAEKGRMSAADAQAAARRIEIIADKRDLAQADVVIEAIVEQLEPKQALFAELEEIVSPDCILASNTSSLSITAIASRCRNRERIAGFHFFNPVPLMKIVEVVPGLQTAQRTVDALVALGEGAGHSVVRTRDTPGFLINHIGRGFGTEALRIHGEGVASFGEIDAVMREAAGFRMGPFELLDLTGIDVSDAVSKSIYHQFFEEPRFRPSIETGLRVAAGTFGRKTGAGFYSYGEQDGGAAVPELPEAEFSGALWLSRDDARGHEVARALLDEAGLPFADDGAPGADALCLVTPAGEDATACALRLGLDPARTIAIDTLFASSGRLTLMGTPLTPRRLVESLAGALQGHSRKAVVTSDSPGFIAPRIVAHIINIACEIAQQG